MGMAGYPHAVPVLRRRVYMESNRNIDGVTERYVAAPATSAVFRNA